MTRVQAVVGIPTFRRPGKLGELLAALPARIAECDHLAAVRVVVVDNDPDGTALDTVSAAPLAVDYRLEPRPGIAAVRNRLLAEAEGADVLCFIDDDELPLDGWLTSLIGTWRETGAAAVMGRVISVFEDDVDPWLLATGVFRRRERVTGTRLPTVAAGNLLVDPNRISAFGLRFDPTLGLSGGEDTLFGRQLVAAGGVIVWCNESRAEDFVPKERLTREWAMRRAFNVGNSSVEIALRLEPRRARRARIRIGALFGGLARAAVSSVRHVWGRATRDLVADARGLRTAYRGCGMAAAAVGIRRREYERSGG